MVKREDVHKDLLLRLVSDYITVPTGTTGIVERVDTLWDGTWYFIVEWDAHEPRPLFVDARGKTRKRSVRVGQRSDLASFEAISQAEREAAVAAFNALRKPKRKPAFPPSRKKVDVDKSARARL